MSDVLRNAPSADDVWAAESRRLATETRALLAEAKDKLGPETPGVPDQDSAWRAIAAKLEEILDLCDREDADGSA